MMEIVKKANDLKKEGKIASSWVIEGKIFVRKSENEPAVRITDVNQLQGEESESENHSSNNQTGSVNLRPRKKPLTLSQLSNQKSKQGKSKSGQQA